jgi:hypothetical protein
MLRRLSMLAALLMSIVVGGSAPVSAQDDDLAAAVDATVATGSVALDMSYVVEGWQDGEVRTLTITATGVTSLGPEPRMWLQADMQDYGLGELEMIVVDRALYLRGDSVAQLVGTGGWIGVDLDSTDPDAVELQSFVSGTNDASLALFWLLGATKGPASIGRERVGDVLAERLVVPIDLDLALDQIPGSLRSVLAAGIDEVRTLGIEPLFEADVWVGVDDGLIHRVKYEFEDVPLGVSRINISYDFHDFGVAVEPTVPDPDDVTVIGDETLSA